jgi:hypothetical protein
MTAAPHSLVLCGQRMEELRCTVQVCVLVLDSKLGSNLDSNLCKSLYVEHVFSVLLVIHPLLCCSTLAGDPIEVGAFTEVFSAASHAHNTPHPFQLSSSKASFGHAEPGAGIVGIFHTLFAQQHNVQLPIMHLREVNPLVGSVLEAAAAANAERLRAFHMPRQAGPAMLGAAEQGGAAGFKTGISAFAFQGAVAGF